MRRETSAGVARLECYRSELACINGQCKRWIPLKDVSVNDSKTSKTHNNVFELISKKSKYVFSVESLAERAEWIAMINDVTKIRQDKLVPSSVFGLIQECENGMYYPQ